MKKNRLSIALLLGLLLFSSCDSWLEQEDKMAFTENQAYTSETGLNSIAANFLWSYEVLARFWYRWRFL